MRDVQADTPHFISDEEERTHSGHRHDGDDGHDQDVGQAVERDTGLDLGLLLVGDGAGDIVLSGDLAFLVLVAGGVAFLAVQITGGVLLILFHGVAHTGGNVGEHGAVLVLQLDVQGGGAVGAEGATGIGAALGEGGQRVLHAGRAGGGGLGGGRRLAPPGGEPPDRGGDRRPPGRGGGVRPRPGDRGLSGGQPPGGPGPARGAGVRAGDTGEFVLGGETPPISAEQPAGDGRCFPGRGGIHCAQCMGVWVEQDHGI